MHVTVAALTVALCQKTESVHHTESSVYIFDQLETGQCNYQIYIRTHRWCSGSRPAHLSRGLSGVGLMVLAAVCVCVYRFGLRDDVIQLSAESLRPQGHSSQQMLL